MGGGLCRQLGKLLRIDADRKYRGAGPAVARNDDAVMHGEAEVACAYDRKFSQSSAVWKPIRS